MVRLLNNILFFGFLLISLNSISQEEKNFKQEEKEYNERDYNKKENFKKFNRRADQISSWQIQNLKYGALVVRLQNNQLKIDACKRVGDIERAKKIIAETQFYNKLMIKAYLSNFNFCKVYFMFAQNSDSLLKGKRQGIFIDTTLTIDNSIVMNESYYLIGEKDYVYNSSIGFVKEDTAKLVTETGSRTIEVPVVLKNKYGHQLKNPFPFFVNRSFLRSSSTYVANCTILYENKSENIGFILSKEITPEKQGNYIMELNARLAQFYMRHQGDQITDKSLTPFLY